MKKIAITTAILSATLAVAACNDAGDDTVAADDTAPAADAVAVEEEPVADDSGSTLTIDNDGASMDVNEPGMDATVDSDGNVNAEVEM